MISLAIRLIFKNIRTSNLFMRVNDQNIRMFYSTKRIGA
jgi:hypothetical protein